MPRRTSKSRHASKPPRHDANHDRAAKRPPRRFRAKEPGGDASDEHGERLQKVLAAAGVASRRECEELIREGRVEVDRQVVSELGTRVDPQRQEIRVDGETLSQPKLIYFAINKPVGVVSTARDPAGRPRLLDLLPRNTPRVFAVGRLDMASEGLILATNDGELANGLTHPRHGVEKVYQVQVAGQVEREVLAKLHRGIHLAEGFAHVKHVKIKSRHKKSTILEMVLDEGRNREVRRLLARVGHKVQRLKRIAVGPVRLGDMPAGAVRLLTANEVQQLERAVAGADGRNQKAENRDGRSAAEQGARPRKPSSTLRKGARGGKQKSDGRTIIG